MLAVVKIGGKQYKISPGDILEVEKIGKKAGLPAVKAGESFEIPEILLVWDGKLAKIGTPLVSEAKVKAKVLEETKGKKIVVFKYKPKKGYRRKRGHRQLLTKIQIEKIEMGK